MLNYRGDRKDWSRFPGTTVWGGFSGSTFILGVVGFKDSDHRCSGSVLTSDDSSSESTHPLVLQMGRIQTESAIGRRAKRQHFSNQQVSGKLLCRRAGLPAFWQRRSAGAVRSPGETSYQFRL